MGKGKGWCFGVETVGALFALVVLWLFVAVGIRRRLVRYSISMEFSFLSTLFPSKCERACYGIVGLSSVVSSQIL
jgi:hypothetical protein